MFKTADKTELNQISLTGLRALVLIGLLIAKPRSFNEIRRAFIDLKIIDEKTSNDILRIDLNTIKLMGCDISRSSAKTDFRYILTKHPFSIKTTKNEISALKKVYNHIKRKADIYLLIEFEEFFRKIINHLCDEESKEALIGVSIFKYYDYDTIKMLVEDCKLRNTLDLTYQKPNAKSECRYQVIAQELVYSNDKIYLHGQNVDNERPIVLNLRRLKNILARRKQEHNFEIKSFKITFLLKNINKDDLTINEDVIDKTDEGYIIEGTYHNEFLAIQRVLSFGARCIVLSPTEFRNTIVEKIKEMRKIYED
ncbi:hypothetical protein IJ384_03160 [bacterium]|nr:hypothetical protein [bacterium]